MKSMFRHYGPVALLLVLILVVSLLLSHCRGGAAKDHRPQVLLTNYPLYLAAQNILGDTDEIRLTLLAGAGTGCLHDYQLTPADRLALEQADRVIINGVGAEPFLEGLVDPQRVVDTAAGLEWLCADSHHHEGDHHHHHHGDYNEHIWLSPQRYRQQVAAVMGALVELDSENTQLYTANGAAYIGQIETLWRQMQTVALTGRPCVLFHDSLSYLAADLGLDVQLTLTAEGESGLSAADLAQVAALAETHPELLLWYDTQYPIRYGAVEGLVPAQQVLALETAVVGQGKTTDWLDAMERNAAKLQKLTGGDTP